MFENNYPTIDKDFSASGGKIIFSDPENISVFFVSQRS